MPTALSAVRSCNANGMAPLVITVKVLAAVVPSRIRSTPLSPMLMVPLPAPVRRKVAVVPLLSVTVSGTPRWPPSVPKTSATAKVDGEAAVLLVVTDSGREPVAFTDATTK